MLYHQCEVPVKFWNTKPIFFHFCSSRFPRSIQSLFFSRSSSLHSAAIIFWTRFNPIPACQVLHQLFGGSCLSSLTPNPFFNSGETDTSAGWPYQGKFCDLACGERNASYTARASAIRNQDLQVLQGLQDLQEPKSDFRYIVGSLRLRPWRRLFNGVNPADSKGEAREGRRWSFKQSLERWRHQYPKYIPSHPIL